jgi:hypothetical protein
LSVSKSSRAFFASSFNFFKASRCLNSERYKAVAMSFHQFPHGMRKRNVKLTRLLPLLKNLTISALIALESD